MGMIALPLATDLQTQYVRVTYREAHK